MIVDAENQVLGRLASNVAKKLLDGEEVLIINSEKAIITGDPKKITEKYRKKREMGDPHHGPYFPKKPDAVLKRTVRGMLPVKKPKGRQALKRLKTYTGNPMDQEGEKLSKSKKEIKTNYITLEELSKSMRGH